MKNLLKNQNAIPKENRQGQKTTSASLAKVESTQKGEAGLWSELTQRKIDYLRSLANLCEFRADNPNDEKFAALLEQAHLLQVISEQKLAGMAGVDRSTANRWLNRKALLRTPLAQSAIMKEIANLSEAQAVELELSMKEGDAGIAKRDKRAKR